MINLEMSNVRYQQIKRKIIMLRKCDVCLKYNKCILYLILLNIYQFSFLNNTPPIKWIYNLKYNISADFIDFFIRFVKCSGM